MTAMLRFIKKMNKIFNYPLDEILLALEDISNHKDINTTLMFDRSISEERRELFQKIRRIFIKHDNDALKKIEELINEINLPAGSIIFRNYDLPVRIPKDDGYFYNEIYECKVNC